MFAVPVEDSNVALLEQQALAMHIVRKILMLIFSDVIRLKVRKYTDVKDKSRNAVKHQRLGGNLHHNSIQPRIHHLPEILLYDKGLRCRIGRRDMLVADDRLDRADKSCLYSCAVKDRFYHIGCRCLALGSGYADCLDVFCRIPEICRRQVRKCFS